MNHNVTRQWNILCWNVRGLNAARKWDSVRNKVVEANCDVCFQETKKDSFDPSFVRKILPANFDDYLFVPSVGVSGGLLVSWKSNLLSGDLRFSTGSSIALNFVSKHDDSVWTLMNVYGPCTPDGKRDFTTWLKNVAIPVDEDWIILGDFNLYRHPEEKVLMLVTCFVSIALLAT